MPHAAKVHGRRDDRDQLVNVLRHAAKAWGVAVPKPEALAFHGVADRLGFPAVARRRIARGRVPACRRVTLQTRSGYLPRRLIRAAQNFTSLAAKARLLWSGILACLLGGKTYARRSAVARRSLPAYFHFRALSAVANSGAAVTAPAPAMLGSGQRRRFDVGFDLLTDQRRPQHHLPNRHSSCNARPDHTLGQLLASSLYGEHVCLTLSSRLTPAARIGCLCHGRTYLARTLAAG